MNCLEKLKTISPIRAIYGSTISISEKLHKVKIKQFKSFMRCYLPCNCRNANKNVNIKKLVILRILYYLLGSDSLILILFVLHFLLTKVDGNGFWTHFNISFHIENMYLFYHFLSSDVFNIKQNIEMGPKVIPNL